MLPLLRFVLRQPSAGRLSKSRLPLRQVFLEWLGRGLGLVDFYVHWIYNAAAVDAAAVVPVD